MSAFRKVASAGLAVIISTAAYSAHLVGEQIAYLHQKLSSPAEDPNRATDWPTTGGRQVDRFLRQMHFTLQEICELDELEAIIKLVEKGVGIALVPHTKPHQQWPAGVRAIDLEQHTFHRDIGLIHRSRQSFTEPVRILAQLISDQVIAVSK